MKCKDCNITNLDLDFYKAFYDWVRDGVYRHIIVEWDNEHLEAKE